MLSALLAAAAFPPFDVGRLAFLAWVPWLLALSRGPSPRVGALSGALHFALLHVMTCSWILPVMVKHGGMGWGLASLSWLVSGLLFTPYGLVIGWAGALLCRRHGAVGCLGLVVVWPVVDALRTRLSLGFAWPIPGMTQAGWPTALGVADLGGVHAVTALVLLANVGVVALLRAWGPFRLAGRSPQFARFTVGVCVLGVGVGLLHGVRQEARFVTPREAQQTLLLEWEEEESWPAEEVPAWDAVPGLVRVALVQGASPEQISMHPRRADVASKTRIQLALTERALVSGAELIVWSESSYPGSLGAPGCLRDLSRLLASAADRGTEVPQAVIGGLVGETPHDRSGTRYSNSALLIGERGLLDRYDKRHLVPFGEYLPWPRVFFWVRKLVPTDLLRGGAPKPLAGARGPLGASVCYEMVLPHHVRELVVTGAEVLLNLTNDGWFHGSGAPEQHLRFSILRAVENRRWVVRSANSGISAVVAPDGRVIGTLPEGTRGALLARVAPRSSLSVYSRLGDRPLGILGLLVLAWLLAVPRRGLEGTSEAVRSVETDAGIGLA